MGVLKKTPKTDYGSGPSEKRKVASGGEQVMRKDQGAEMSNTTESAWDHLGEAECWPAPVEGRQGGAVVRAGVCAVLKEPVTSGAFSFCLLVPESLSSSSRANPCPYSS